MHTLPRRQQWCYVVETYKARLCVNGANQKITDVFSLFAPVLQHRAVVHAFATHVDYQVFAENRCWYSHLEMFFEEGNPWICSLERLDPPAKGYVKENIKLIVGELTGSHETSLSSLWILNYPQLG